MSTPLPSLAIRAVVSVYVPLNAFRKGGINKSGASLAFVFAHTTLVLCRTTVFAVSLLTFFFLGSRATKYKASVKAKLEEQHHAPASQSKGSKQKNLSAGNRDAKQVACNGLLGMLACAVWIMACSKVERPVAEAGLSQDQRLSNAMVFMAVGFFAACMGDTLASELGMLARSKPKLITTFRTVEPGVNGGVTPWGTFVSFAGGQIISIAALICLTAEGRLWKLASLASNDLRVLSMLAAVGGAAGFAGSLLDSLLGATLQETLYHPKRKMVVHSRIDPSTGKIDPAVISFAGQPILSNNGVNAIASAITGLAAGWVGWKYT